MEKLGVTGPWTLGLGLATLLVSKEIYVYNEEVWLVYSSGDHVHSLLVSPDHSRVNDVWRVRIWY